jgi:hypothetical protein
LPYFKKPNTKPFQTDPNPFTNFQSATTRWNPNNALANYEDIVTRVPPRFFPHFPLPDVYGHAGRLIYFDAQGNMHNDDHWWNSFLAGVEVGFENFVGMLTAKPIEDHFIETGYIAHIQQYLTGGSQPPMQW